MKPQSLQCPFIRILTPLATTLPPPYFFTIIGIKVANNSDKKHRGEYRHIETPHNFSNDTETNMSNARACATALVILGAAALVATFVILIAFPNFYQKELEKHMTLRNDTILYDVWKDLPIPIYQKLYFFNVTNGEGFKKGEVLKVEEVGPYTYASRWTKEDIEWSNGTVSYREVKTFHFDREKSVGPEDDLVHTINGPIVLAAENVRDKEAYKQFMINFVVEGLSMNLVITKSVRELAFEGYHDKIIEYLNTWQEEKRIDIDIPYKNGTFAWLYDRNATDDGNFTVYSGEENHRMLNIIKEWNGQSELNFWKGEVCNMINGTNGELGPSLFANQTTYSFFQPTFCRSLKFDYEKNKVHKGINSRRFRNTRNIFNDETLNECFVQDSELPSGVLDLGPCQFDAPIVLSFPHFYLADPNYLELVDGLSPNKTSHESFLDIEPTTGLTVGLTMRFQLNVHLHNSSAIWLLQNLTDGVYPIFWMEMLTEISDDLAVSMDYHLRRSKVIAFSLLGLIAVFSVVFLIVGLVLLRKSKSQMWTETEPLLEKGRDSSYSTIATCPPKFNGSGSFQNNLLSQSVSPRFDRQQENNAKTLSVCVHDQDFQSKRMSTERSGDLMTTSKVATKGSESKTATTVQKKESTSQKVGGVVDVL